MANSLITGVSGLQSHQAMIEIVGNNLANLNTVGFKERSAIFSDVLYETLRGGSGGTQGVSGGTNPIQIGTGSVLSSTRTKLKAGSLESTGGDLDLALDGDGYFVMNNGTTNLYSRAGTFQIDKNGMLVDSGTGYPVQRYGTVGEASDEFPSYQTVGKSNINIPLGASVRGKATEKITVSGNLPSSGALPTTQILSTGPWQAGGTPANTSTLLNSLDAVTTAYQSGDSITIAGTDINGAAISVNLGVDNTTTVGDLLNAVSSAFPGATASIDAAGAVTLTADAPGASFMSLSFANATGNTGSVNFGTFPIIEMEKGLSGATIQGGARIYDSAGGVHTINYEFIKQADATWTMTATMDPSDGVLIDNQVTGVTFNPDGSFNGISGTGLGDGKLSAIFAGQTTPLTFQVVLNGGSSSGNALTSYSGDGSVSSSTDGYGNGVLTSVQVDSSGTVQGIASNGIQFPIAQIAIATFRNPQGLNSVGGNFFSASLSSGDVQLSGAGANGTGLVRSGQLEQSNVDIAVEFTRLIIAQRGFSANSRTITVTNDILQELNNLIR